ncbi:MlaD family protein [Mycobacterium avium]|uniref:MlaD family protein n=1 Tax=Mycobacterium avium TaxID=1764 RepID=UPI001CC5D21B|nr:MlaD family protein [Mycobacterium avium]MBZ4521816.1 MCE family protein [Mycobacterium avium subsp. hominissuis]MBZ4531172.1 MCE family protein [Mycobacterium avium subsp. hominissuis]
MRLRAAATFIAFALMIAVSVGYIASLGVRIGPPSQRTNVSMEVADTNSLVVGSNVLLRGVPVGKVSKIEASIHAATVDFYIDNRYKVPVDSEVRLENLSALGESYIGLVPQRQDGPMLHDGQRIATQRVIEPPSISELATSVARVLNQADPDALKRITGEIDTALPNPNAVLPNLSRTSVLLRNVAADMHGRGRDLLDNFQTLLQNAGWLGPLLADVTPLLPPIGTHADRLIGAVGLAITNGSPMNVWNLNRYLDRIQKFIDTNAGDLKVLGEALRPQLKGIAGALMNFDTGQILSNFLASVPADGAITLHMTIPPK